MRIMKRKLLIATRGFLNWLSDYVPNKYNINFLKRNVRLYRAIQNTYTPEERLSKLHESLDRIKGMRPSNKNDFTEFYEEFYED